VIADAWHWISVPWSSGLVDHAFVELVLLGVVGGALGCWVVLYGLSYSAESLSHALFPGLVVAALLGFSYFAGGIAGVIVAALAIAIFGRTPHIGRDTAVAVVISSLFGFGVLLGLSPQTPAGLQSLLFGNLLGLETTDLLAAAGLAVVVLIALRLLHGELLAVGFDRGGSRALGAHPLFADAALLVLLALAVVVASQGLGNLLAPAVLIGPAATARLLSRRMLPMMATAFVITVAAGTVGLYVSFHLRAAGGASVAGSMVVLYVLIRAWTSVHRHARPEFATE
jgi:ABC-type Mn2+/Zn2+ transport system permease subunit